MKHEACWIAELSLKQQEAERKHGFRSTMQLARELLEQTYNTKRIDARMKHQMEHALLQLHNDIFVLAHLNGYIDCEGQWIAGKR